jgi:hypothetical protein
VSAADVIKGWSSQLTGSGSGMHGGASAIQTGNPVRSSDVIVAYADIFVTRVADGTLSSPETILYFSDRTQIIPGESRQPFAVNQVDGSEFQLTPSGQLVMKSETWGGTEVVTLNDLGNSVLGGWGVNSIGNNQVPPYWTITLNGQVAT